MNKLTQIPDRGVWALGLMAVAAAVLFPPKASAVPAFARQTEMACAACHYQHYPALNAFGRAFKQGGYTMTNSQGQVEGEDLSLPVVLNASLITKLRYQKTNGSSDEGTDRGELQFPDEAALLIGGRAGEHVGFLLEAALIDDMSFNSYKAHFNYPVGDVNYGAVAFLTDAGGAPYGFELFNTGAQRFMRAVEDRRAVAAQQFIGSSGGMGSPGASDAEGIALVASRSDMFANLSFWTPDHGAVAVDGFANYLRVGYMPTVRGWDTGIGVQYFTGTASRSALSGGDVDTDAWFIDGQAQGRLGGKPVGLYFTYGAAEGGGNNYFNTNPNDQEAWSVLGELGLTPNKWTVYAGYLNGDNGSDPALGANEDERMTVGTSWSLAQNVRLELYNTSYSGNKYDPEPVAGGDNLTTLMLFAGF